MSHLSRLTSALWWIAAGVVGWLAIRTIASASMPDQLLGWAFLTVGVWCLWLGYKEFRSGRRPAAPRASAPITSLPPLPRRRDSQPPLPVDTTAWRHPLTADLREQLLSVTALLRRAGIVETGEFSDAELVECAERTDAFEEMDIGAVVMILGALAEERTAPLRHLAFFTDQVEMSEDDPFAMVAELVRISGSSSQPRQERFELTGDALPAGEPHPPTNAVLEFDLDGRRHTVAFTFYAKYLPAGLIEQAVPILTPPGSTRRFFHVELSDHPVITCAEPTAIAALNAALGTVPTWVPL